VKEEKLLKLQKHSAVSNRSPATSGLRHRTIDQSQLVKDQHERAESINDAANVANSTTPSDY